MTVEAKSVLETELGELYDIRTMKMRLEKSLTNEAFESKKDVKMIILMFSDGIPNINLPLSDEESLEWDAQTKRLIYHRKEFAQFIEAANNETLVRVRPYLKDLVKKAKEYYLYP